MNKLAARAGVTTFFIAVLAVSVAMLAKKGDEDALGETVNTMPEEYRVATDVIYDETDSNGYRRDLDIEMPPVTENTFPPEDDVMMPENADHVPEISGDVEVEDHGHSSGNDNNEVTAAPEETAPAVTTTRTVITSRQRKDYDSNSVYIDMANILQNPELPVGCEITALTILLNHYGFNAEKTDMARNYLPTSWGNPKTVDGKNCKDSFYDYFIGDPFSRGYGCFSPAIERAANKYISSHGGGYTVKNISGCHPDTLYEYLIKGTPVLCWATDGMIEPEYYETWYDPDTGEQLDWYLNEHCFVLAGFNIASSTVTLNDPMKGIIDYNIDKFEVRFKQMHSQAIVLIPEGGSEVTETAAPETTITESVSETTVSETEPPAETTTAETTVPSETETEQTAATSEETMLIIFSPDETVATYDTPAPEYF